MVPLCRKGAGARWLERMGGSMVQAETGVGGHTSPASPGATPGRTPRAFGGRLRSVGQRGREG